jgi:hypothetical protein
MGRAKPKGKGKDGMPTVAWGGEEEGPRVHLDPERAKKMFGDPPATGSEHHIQGHARVVGAREEPRSDGGEGPVHSIEIVIHHMGAEPKSAVDAGKKSLRDDVEAAAGAVEKRDKSTSRETSVQGKAQREKSQRSQAPAEQKSW